MSSYTYQVVRMSRFYEFEILRRLQNCFYATRSFENWNQVCQVVDNGNIIWATESFLVSSITPVQHQVNNWEQGLGVFHVYSSYPWVYRPACTWKSHVFWTTNLGRGTQNLTIGSLHALKLCVFPAFHGSLDPYTKVENQTGKWSEWNSELFGIATKIFSHLLIWKDKNSIAFATIEQVSLTKMEPPLSLSQFTASHTRAHTNTPLSFSNLSYFFLPH